MLAVCSTYVGASRFPGDVNAGAPEVPVSPLVYGLFPPTAPGVPIGSIGDVPEPFAAVVASDVQVVPPSVETSANAQSKPSSSWYHDQNLSSVAPTGIASSRVSELAAPPTLPPHQACVPEWMRSGGVPPPPEPAPTRSTSRWNVRNVFAALGPLFETTTHTVVGSTRSVWSLPSRIDTVFGDSFDVGVYRAPPGTAWSRCGVTVESTSWPLLSNTKTSSWSAPD